MRYVVRGDLRASVIGFGCGAVLGRVGRKDSLRAMEAAWAEGINLFDVARSYGYGEAEGLLGEFLVGKRDKAVISTKFGIWPEKQPGWKQAAKPFVRGLLQVAPGVRKLVRRAAASTMTPNQFTVPVLRASLEESLRKLRTDYVDVLFMHSAPEGVLQDEALLRELERVVAEGKVRLAGISADPSVIQQALQQNPPALGAMQFAANVFDLAVTEYSRADAGKHFFLANHPFGGVTRVEESKQKLIALSTAQNLQPELREKLALVDNQLLADVVFNVILRQTGIDAIVPSMMKISNLKTNVAAVTASRFSDEEVSVLRSNLHAR